MRKKFNLYNMLLWIFEGIIVGFSAIMPGISGGTLCVAFGMYRPIINVLSSPKINVKKYGVMLSFFCFGGAVGFVGLSGLADRLMDVDSVAVTCAFIGFILGTIPKLWTDAGVKGRNIGALISLFFAFLATLTLMLVLKSNSNINISTGFWGFIFCGIIWGLSFIIPGLSSSTLLLFFGLYQPMLKGIAAIDLKVLIPLGIGITASILLLSNCINYAYKRQYTIISHAIIGVVIATTVMIVPDREIANDNMLVALACIAVGAIMSFLFTKICVKTAPSDGS